MRLLFGSFLFVCFGSSLWPVVHHNICVSLSLSLSSTSLSSSCSSDFLMFHCANNKTGRGFDVCLTFVYVNGRRMRKRRWWRSVLMNTIPPFSTGLIGIDNEYWRVQGVRYWLQPRRVITSHSPSLKWHWKLMMASFAVVWSWSKATGDNHCPNLHPLLFLTVCCGSLYLGKRLFVRLVFF